MPAFREVPGLVRKYCSRDETTGEWAGIYLWDSEASLAAYELTEPPQIERFDIVDVFRT